MKSVKIIGAGLAGVEAAMQCSRRGVKVELYEMRPGVSTGVHKTEKFAEMVCSNSLRATSLENAAGLLKEEMRRLGSMVMGAAKLSKVPAGGALAVDRDIFSSFITETLEEEPLINIHREEVTKIPEDGIVILASGPLTSPALSQSICKFTSNKFLYFYDAIAPIVSTDSIDNDKVFRQSRYDKGDGDEYLNCPMTKAQYQEFHKALCEAECVALKDIETAKHFEGCLPIEVMAKRGEDTMRYGPLKPVGLTNPITGKKPYAVVQLRQEKLSGEMFNLVGFQTNLKWPEQERVFRMIPGLESAEFLRLGQMHRNTFINAPVLLQATYQAYKRESLFFAGQMTGVEGYIESAASGIVAGLNAARFAKGEPLLTLPPETAMGALAHYVSSADPEGFQPMKINWGIFPTFAEKIKKKDKKKALSERGLLAMEGWLASLT